jgi:hypothetical protein
VATLRRRVDVEALAEIEVLSDLADQAERIGAASEAAIMRERIGELQKRI